MKEQKLNKEILSGMMWKFGERFLAQGISFLVSIILARILLPSDYGLVAIVSVFIAVADILVTSGLSTSLIQKKDSNQLDFSTIFYCSVLLGIISYAALFLSAPFISKRYGEPLLVPVIRVFALKVPISAVNSVQSAYVSKYMMFKRFFYATLVGTLISGVAGIAMALYGFGVWALLVQNLANSVIDTTMLFLTVKWKPSLQFSLKASIPLVRYGWKVMFTDLIGTIFNQLNSFVIGLSYSSADLAYYTKGKNFPELINSNIFTALGSVLFPAMSKVADEKQLIVGMTRQSIKISTYVLYPLMVGMAVVADSMIDILLTDKWAMAVPYVRLGCLAGIFSVASTVKLQTIKGLGRSDVTLKIEFFKKPFYIICLLVAVRINVFAVGVVLPLVSAWEAGINSIALSKLVDYPLTEQLKDLYSALCLSAAMGILVHFVSFLEMPSFITLVIQVLLGVWIYIAISAVMKLEQYKYLKHLLKMHRS